MQLAEIKAIIMKLNVHKTPGTDLITAQIIAECPRKAIVFYIYTYILNTAFKTRLLPKQWKLAKVIMLRKPGKPLDDSVSYRPISLLPTLSTIFEKIIYSGLHTVLPYLNIIPEHQFGFRAKHSTMEQIHRVAVTVRNALEANEYCPPVFLDVKQAFDRVWIQGLLHKIKDYPPSHLHSTARILPS